jgi:dCTP diphosphatase
MDSLEGLRTKLNQLFEARDWHQFHAPKNLAMSLASEAAELMQPFRWMSEQQSWKPPVEVMRDIEDEVGDVLINLVALCDELGVDPVLAAERKLAKIAARYPLEQNGPSQGLPRPRSASASEES